MKIDLPEKRYYSIGEVASKFQVKTSLIRFWEQEFKILNPKKNSRGNRKFTSKDIEIDKSEVQLPDGPIKEIGEHNIMISVHPEVSIQVLVKVSPE